MPTYFMGFADFLGQWAIDRAGVQSGRYRIDDIAKMVREGSLQPRAWLRHVWTQKFALAGEVLYQHGKVDEDQFDRWFPVPRVA